MPIRGDEIETLLTVNRREYLRGFQDAERDAQRFVQRTNRTLSGLSSGGGGRSFLPGLAQISEVIQGIPQIGRLAGALVNPLTQAAEAGIRFNMFMENAQVGFEGIAGGAEKANRHIGVLTRFSDEKRLNFEGILRGSQYMNIFGFALDEHVPKLQTWMSTIAASGKLTEDSIEGVVRGFGQMVALQRVNAEEASQLAERGIPFWELLAKAIGKTVAETRKLGEQGRLKGRPAVEAVTAMMAQDPRFQGQLERRAGTLEGRLTQLENVRARAEGIAAQNLTQDLSLSIEGALSQSDLANRMAGGINAAIGPVSGLIRGAIVTTVGGGISGGFEDAVTAAKSVLPAQIMSLGTDGIINPLKAVLGIQSPSKVTFEMGLSLAEGLRNGFTAGMRLGFFQVGTGGGIRERLEAAADNPVVRAFFEAIRQAEGGAPNRIVGGGTFSDMSRHPNRVGFRGPAGPSTAAGSYQITGTNWRRIAPILGLTDFAARNQLLAALYLFNEEGGLDKLLAGDVEGAIRAAGRDWAAVPGSPLPGRSVSTATFTNNFQQALGGAGLSSMSVEQQRALIFQMAQSMGIWPKPSPGGDLSGGTGVFASGGGG